MSYKLFIDDDVIQRGPLGDSKEWVWCVSSGQAIDHVRQHGMPHYISFDHDLGGADTSMIFVNWLVEHVMDHNLPMPEGFDFYVHSQNPIGAKAINSLMGNFIKHRWSHM